MKRVFRWTFRLLLVLVVLVIAGILLLDTIVRMVVVTQIRNQTGLEAKIGRVHIGLFHPEVTIESLVLYNTPEFGGTSFIDLPELHVEYDPEALWSRKLHCKFVRFNLARINIVEDKNGRINCNLLQPKPRAQANAGNAPRKNPPAQTGSTEMEFTGIDKLNLTLGKATYMRMRQPNQVDELNMNMNHQIFPNLKSQQDFYGLLFVVYLKSTTTGPSGGNSSFWAQIFTPPRN